MNEYEFVERVCEEKAEVLLKRSVPLRGNLKLSTGKIGNMPEDTNLPSKSPRSYIKLYCTFIIERILEKTEHLGDPARRQQTGFPSLAPKTATMAARLFPGSRGWCHPHGAGCTGRTKGCRLWEFTDSKQTFQLGDR